MAKISQNLKKNRKTSIPNSRLFWRGMKNCIAAKESWTCWLWKMNLSHFSIFALLHPLIWRLSFAIFRIFQENAMLTQYVTS